MYHGGEAEAGTATNLLRREKRLEHVGADAGVHPHAAIRDGEHRVRSGNRPEVRLRECLVEIDVGGFDRELAPFRHGIARVHREVHNHLLDLIGIGAHAP